MPGAAMASPLAIADLRCFCDVPRGSACASRPEPQAGALGVGDMLHAPRQAKQAAPMPGRIADHRPVRYSCRRSQFPTGLERSA
jgi:hypothetical protein